MEKKFVLRKVGFKLRNSINREPMTVKNNSQWEYRIE